MFALLGMEESRHLRIKVRGLGQFSDTRKGQGSLSKEAWKKPWPGLVHWQLI